MATLSAQVRADATAELQRTADCPGGITKADLRAAIDAADDWADANASAYNLALPVAARNALTARQKARLLVFVIQKRWEQT